MEKMERNRIKAAGAGRKCEVRLAPQVSWSFATALGYLKVNRRPVVAKLHRRGSVKCEE
jgi:hypothetical protein